MLQAWTETVVGPNRSLVNAFCSAVTESRSPVRACSTMLFLVNTSFRHAGKCLSTGSAISSALGVFHTHDRNSADSHHHRNTSDSQAPLSATTLFTVEQLGPLALVLLQYFLIHLPQSRVGLNHLHSVARHEDQQQSKVAHSLYNRS